MTVEGEAELRRFDEADVAGAVDTSQLGARASSGPTPGRGRGGVA
jgi:hypothetical protein